METLLFLLEVNHPIHKLSAVSFDHTLQTSAKMNKLKNSNPILVRPGKSLEAIQSGLESSVSKSIILVFTDAAPSDNSLLSEIIEAIEKTSSKVLFSMK